MQKKKISEILSGGGEGISMGGVSGVLEESRRVGGHLYGDQSETVNRSYFCAKNDRREVGMNTQWIALIISLLGFLASVYYSNKNSKKTDIDDAVKRAELNTKISTKLDNIASDVRETSKNVDRLREEIVEHGSRITAVEQSVKSAHHRIDKLEKSK